MIVICGFHAHNIARLLCNLIALNALSASLLHGEFFKIGTLAHTVLGHD